MGEVAGLVIGGVGLLSLFESGMNAFDHIETARHYGGDYEKYSLKLALLHLRLSRWAKGVELASAVQAIGTAKEGEKANDLLGQIVREIQRTERIAQRYQVDGDPAPAQSASDQKVDVVAALVAKVNSLALRRQKKTSLTQKTRWALRDQSKFKDLLVEIDGLIKDLEILFSTTLAPEVTQLASAEAQELIEASSVEEPRESDASSTRMALLSEGTEGIDSLLQAALQRAAPSTSKHIFTGKFLQSEEARVFIGTYVAPGNTASSIDSTEFSGDFTSTGKARVNIGNQFGGKHVFD